MAVFTKVDADAFGRWARARLGFASAGALRPIAEGIENTNYRFAGDGREYVFTIFEVWDAARARYYARLARHLSARGIPAPAPVDAELPDAWEGKPCVVAPFAPGEWLRRPGAAALRTMGDMTARLHRAAADFPAAESMPNPRGAAWRMRAGREVAAGLSEDDRALLRSELECDRAFSALRLPTAECHCDLFRNNVLWTGTVGESGAGGEISAVIDFYFGGREALVFDLAVCCCDWCFDAAAGDFDDAKLAALLAGYRAARRLTGEEEAAFPSALRAAALRFWISRLHDLRFPRRAEALTPHDPAPFRSILLAARRRGEAAAAGRGGRAARLGEARA